MALRLLRRAGRQLRPARRGALLTVGDRPEAVLARDLHALAHPGDARARVRHAVDDDEAVEANAHAAIHAARRSPGSRARGECDPRRAAVPPPSRPRTRSSRAHRASARRGLRARARARMEVVPRPGSCGALWPQQLQRATATTDEGGGGHMTMYVAGEWRGAAREEEVRSPYDGEVVGLVPVADAADAGLAITAAVDGARAMRALSAFERSEILRRAADADGAARSTSSPARSRSRSASRSRRRAARRRGSRRSCARAPPRARACTARRCRSTRRRTAPASWRSRSASRAASSSRSRRSTIPRCSSPTRSGPRSPRATRSC